MAKTQPKIDDIKGLTQWINFLWLKLKDLFSAEGDTANDNYLPKINDVDKKLVKSNIHDDGITPKYGVDKIWHSGNDGGNIGRDDIKDVLGLVDYNNNNKQDIFISGWTTSSPDDFNSLLDIGSYKVNGAYSHAPNQNCGTSTVNTVVRGTLNVFRSGTNDWETIQQLFWVLSGKTEQYQRSYYGTGGTGWTDWKRLIKCDDYATLDRGGIISEANMAELFRAPDLIQLWNTDDLPLVGGNTYYLDTLSIMVTTQNSIDLDGTDITGLSSERRYRVTYEVHYEKVEEGEGEVTIRIEDRSVELYSVTDYMHDFEIRKRTTFSVILTNIENVTPSIEVGSELNISILHHCYQVSVEEIKFPLFTPFTPV